MSPWQDEAIALDESPPKQGWEAQAIPLAPAGASPVAPPTDAGAPATLMLPMSEYERSKADAARALTDNPIDLKGGKPVYRYSPLQMAERKVQQASGQTMWEWLWDLPSEKTRTFHEAFDSNRLKNEGQGAKFDMEMAANTGMSLPEAAAMRKKLNPEPPPVVQQADGIIARIGKPIGNILPHSERGLAQITERFREMLMEPGQHDPLRALPPLSEEDEARMDPFLPIAPATTAGEKVSDAVGGIAAFGINLAILHRAMPEFSANYPTVTWEVANQASGGEKGMGAFMQLGLGAAGKVAPGKGIVPSLQRGAIVGGGFGGMAAVGGGDTKDILINAGIPFLFEGFGIGTRAWKSSRMKPVAAEAIQQAIPELTNKPIAEISRALDEIASESKVSEKPSTIAPAAKAALPPALEADAVALANVSANKAKAEMGLGEVERGTTIPQKQRLETAYAESKADPQAAARLITRLENTPGGKTTIEEDALLLVERRRIQNELNPLLRQNQEAMESGDGPLQAVIKPRIAELEAEQARLLDVGGRAGTPIGEQLAFRNLWVAPDYTPATHVAKVTDAKGRPLTEKEKSKAVADATKYEDLQKRIDALDAANVEQARELAMAQAALSERMSKASGGRPRGGSRENVVFTADRVAKAKAELDAAFAERHAGVTPKEVTNSAILLGDLLERGFWKFEEAAAKAIEMYGEKIRPYLSEAWKMAQSELHDAKRINATVASLEKSIAEYDRKLATGDIAPKAKGPKTPDTPEVAALRAERDAKKAEVQELREQAKLADKIADLQGKLESGDIAKPEPGAKKTPSETKAKLQKELDNLRYKMERARMTLGDKILDRIATGASVMRMIFGGDLSPILRQLRPVLFNDVGSIPVNLVQRKLPQTTWAVSSAKGIASYFSQARFEGIIENLEQSPWVPFAKEFKLWTESGPDAKFANRTESYPVHNFITEQFPLMKRGERAAVVLNNAPVIALMEQLGPRAQADGTLSTQQGRSDFAHNIGKMVGRGILPKNENIRAFAEVATKTMISARFRWGNLANLTTGYGTIAAPTELSVRGAIDMLTRNPALRRNGMQTMLGGALTVGTIALIANEIWPDSVTINPFSTDFMKIKIGNTRYELLAGMGPMIRAIVICATGKRLVNGKLVHADSMDTFWRYVASGQHNAITTIGTIFTGKDFKGAKIDPTAWGYTKAGMDMFLYTWFNDGVDSFQDAMKDGDPTAQALAKAALDAGLSMTGEGVQTY